MSIEIYKALAKQKGNSFSSPKYKWSVGFYALQVERVANEKKGNYWPVKFQKIQEEKFKGKYLVLRDLSRNPPLAQLKKKACLSIWYIIYQALKCKLRIIHITSLFLNSEHQPKIKEQYNIFNVLFIGCMRKKTDRLENWIKMFDNRNNIHRMNLLFYWKWNLKITKERSVLFSNKYLLVW